MAGEIRKLRFLEGVTVSTPISENIIGGLSGEVSLSVGESSKTISFESPLPSLSYKVFIGIESPDLNAAFLVAICKNKTLNGFDVILNGPVDSNNYKIFYMVTL